MKNRKTLIVAISIFTVCLVAASCLTSIETNDIASYDSSYEPRWGEIPAYVGDDNYQYVTHMATMNGEQVRNFTICFDERLRAAIWVAYPYHTIYDGGSNRTNDWGFDPLIAEYQQADLTKSYAVVDGVSYDRGHQICSADRQCTAQMNGQTFYYSNMTPQNSSLNRGQWASLERKVRAQVCSDTLYVVTGADFSETLGSTTDNSGNVCPIPHAFFKVLLRTRAGDSGKAVGQCDNDELQAIGFWVENAYTGVAPTAVSVSEIEAKCGLELFPMIPQEVKSHCDVSLWSGL